MSKDSPEWKECSTLEQWVETMVRAGQIKTVKMIIRNLPLRSREKYRDIYVRIQSEKKALDKRASLGQ